VGGIRTTVGCAKNYLMRHSLGESSCCITGTRLQK
jgi:hypothetical protein